MPRDDEANDARHGPITGRPKYLERLNEMQKREIVDAAHQEAPALIAHLRAKLPWPEHEKDDEYLGQEMMDFNKFCREASLSFDVSGHITSDAWNMIIDSIIADIAQAAETDTEEKTPEQQA